MTLEKIFNADIEKKLLEVENYLGKKFYITTYDNCVDDIIWFGQDRFTGSFRKPKFDGTKCLRVIILKDGYGQDKQQHTFTVALMKSHTSKTYIKGSEFKIKGRNLYKHFTYCENYLRNERKHILNEKHERGDDARWERKQRIREREQEIIDDRCL